jgi:hypothetical protein
MARYGASDALIATELDQMRTRRIGPTANRSVVGTNFLADTRRTRTPTNSPHGSRPRRAARSTEATPALPGVHRPTTRPPVTRPDGSYLASARPARSDGSARSLTTDRQAKRAGIEGERREPVPVLQVRGGRPALDRGRAERTPIGLHSRADRAPSTSTSGVTSRPTRTIGWSGTLTLTSIWPTGEPIASRCDGRPAKRKRGRR